MCNISPEVCGQEQRSYNNHLLLTPTYYSLLIHIQKHTLMDMRTDLIAVPHAGLRDPNLEKPGEGDQSSCS